MTLKQSIIEEINELLYNCPSIETEIAMSRMRGEALRKMRDEIGRAFEEEES